jgi:3',5'-cyclic AMP phosphodiesterase CpdA
MATVRILHASDLHISIHRNMVSSIDHFSHLRDQDNLNLWTLAKLARELYTGFRKKMTASSYDSVVLKRLALFIYENAKKKYLGDRVLTEDGPDKIDAVVITGDLATTGSANDIAAVRDFLRSPASLREPYLNSNHEATLAAVASPVWYLPGNHDRFEPTCNWVPVGKFSFPKFFDPGGVLFDSELIDFRSNPAQLLGVVEDDSMGPSIRVVLIAADFSLRRFGAHEGLYGWLAQGLIDDRILQKLEGITNDQRAEHEEKHSGTLCVLWAIHFPPGFPHISGTNRMLNEQLLIDKANHLGVSAILAGHTHEQVRYRKPKMSFDVLSCGSTDSIRSAKGLGCEPLPDY